MAKDNNILLARIDNRLVHGQIVCLWAGAVGANLIVVADDETAENEIEKSVMKMAASSLGYDTRFFTIQKTIDIIDKASDDQHILLICQTPKDLRRVIEGGVKIKEVDIGNLYYDEGKEKLTDKVSVSKEDLKDLNYINEEELKDLNYIKKHVDRIYIQDTPDSLKQEF